MNNPNSSLFTCTVAKPLAAEPYTDMTASIPTGKFVEEFTVDLSRIALITARQDGSYWLNLGASSIPMSRGIGDQVKAAWIAYVGKFDPNKMR